MVADKVRDIYEAEGKERMSEGGKTAGNGRPKKGVENLPHPKTAGKKSRDKAAETVGVSGKLADAAKTPRPDPPKQRVSSYMPDIDERCDYRNSWYAVPSLNCLLDIPASESEDGVSKAFGHNQIQINNQNQNAGLGIYGSTKETRCRLS